MEISALKIKKLMMINKILIFLIVCTLSASRENYSQWTLQNYDTNYALTNINFLNEHTGFAGGARLYFTDFTSKGVIYKTTNAGTNWNIVFLDTNILINGVYCLNSDTCLAYGGYYTLQPKMLRSTNGGNNWYYINTGEITSSINSLNFFGNIAFATCKNGIYKSTNNGNNWANVLPQFGYDAGSFFLNSNTGWCNYDNGHIFKTTNSGINWQLVYSNPAYSYGQEMFFTDANTGYAILDSGFISKILKTSDGGTNWIVLNPGLINYFKSIFFVNENTGYISGNGGNVTKTTDAGNSWAISWTGWGTSWNDIHFLDPYVGYVCGDNSIILKTTNGGFIGIPPISTEIPKDFTLYQNYPNPFNPTTNIKFSIPKAAFVTLAVYDMLGREIQTLVSENLSPATYEVKWDAAQFSSGIYFYKLLTSDFALVKKMSVIK
jgi:photosystem II stability/assembly factor-like uncharacterized protein